jgi:hypothetical protein
MSDIEAAMREAERKAEAYQAQGTGVPVPEADAHPLVPGNDGRRPT